MSSFFIRKIQRTITRHQLLKGGEKVLLGVSGGPDSMALLQALWEIREEWRLGIIVAYFNHGLRPEASAEQSFVGERAAALGLPFVTETGDVYALRQKRHLPLQEAAREIRYRFFLKKASEFSAGKIALGHTADDQAESVLMRLLRGSGTRGLAGIPPKREDRIIRPLIEIWRQEVEGFLRERNIPFREDASNRSFHFLRNRIRHELMPILEQYNPQIKQILCQMADRFRQEEDYWQDLMREKSFLLMQNQTRGSVSLEISKIAALPVPLRLRMIRRALEMVVGHLRGFGFVHFQAVENLWQNPAAHKYIRLPNEVVVSKSYRELDFCVGRDQTPYFEYVVCQPGVLEIPEIGREMSFLLREKTGEERMGNIPGKALLEADRIHFPFTVRSFRPGDRFRPLGMEGEKKLKDFFIDQKIPLAARRKIPLLFFQNQLLWIAGLRLDDRFRVKPESRRILQVELREKR